MGKMYGQSFLIDLHRRRGMKRYKVRATTISPAKPTGAIAD